MACTEWNSNTSLAELFQDIEKEIGTDEYDALLIYVVPSQKHENLDSICYWFSDKESKKTVDYVTAIEKSEHYVVDNPPDAVSFYVITYMMTKAMSNPNLLTGDGVRPLYVISNVKMNVRDYLRKGLSKKKSEKLETNNDLRKIMRKFLIKEVHVPENHSYHIVCNEVIKVKYEAKRQRALADLEPMKLIPHI